MLKWSEEEREKRSNWLLDLGHYTRTHGVEARKMSSQVKSEKRLYVGNLATSVDEQVPLLPN